MPDFDKKLGSEQNGRAVTSNEQEVDTTDSANENLAQESIRAQDTSSTHQSVQGSTMDSVKANAKTQDEQVADNEDSVSKNQQQSEATEAHSESQVTPELQLQGLDLKTQPQSTQQKPMLSQTQEFTGSRTSYAPNLPFNQAQSPMPQQAPMQGQIQGSPQSQAQYHNFQQAPAQPYSQGQGDFAPAQGQWQGNACPQFNQVNQNYQGHQVQGGQWTHDNYQGSQGQHGQRPNNGMQSQQGFNHSNMQGHGSFQGQPSGSFSSQSLSKAVRKNQAQDPTMYSAPGEVYNRNLANIGLEDTQESRLKLLDKARQMGFFVRTPQRDNLDHVYEGMPERPLFDFLHRINLGFNGFRYFGLRYDIRFDFAATLDEKIAHVGEHYSHNPIYNPQGWLKVFTAEDFNLADEILQEEERLPYRMISLKDLVNKRARFPLNCGMYVVPPETDAEVKPETEKYINELGSTLTSVSLQNVFFSEYLYTKNAGLTWVFDKESERKWMVEEEMSMFGFLFYPVVWSMYELLFMKAIPSSQWPSLNYVLRQCVLMWADKGLTLRFFPPFEALLDGVYRSLVIRKQAVTKYKEHEYPIEINDKLWMRIFDKYFQLFFSKRTKFKEMLERYKDVTMIGDKTFDELLTKIRGKSSGKPLTFEPLLSRRVKAAACRFEQQSSDVAVDSAFVMAPHVHPNLNDAVLSEQQSYEHDEFNIEYIPYFEDIVEEFQASMDKHVANKLNPKSDDHIADYATSVASGNQGSHAQQGQNTSQTQYAQNAQQGEPGIQGRFNPRNQGGLNQAHQGSYDPNIQGQGSLNQGLYQGQFSQQGQYAQRTQYAQHGGQGGQGGFNPYRQAGFNQGYQGNFTPNAQGLGNFNQGQYGQMGGQGGQGGLNQGYQGNYAQNFQNPDGMRQGHNYGQSYGQNNWQNYAQNRAQFPQPNGKWNMGNHANGCFNPNFSQPPYQPNGMFQNYQQPNPQFVPNGRPYNQRAHMMYSPQGQMQGNAGYGMQGNYSHQGMPNQGMPNQNYGMQNQSMQQGMRSWSQHSMSAPMGNRQPNLMSAMRNMQPHQGVFQGQGQSYTSQNGQSWQQGQSQMMMRQGQGFNASQGNCLGNGLGNSQGNGSAHYNAAHNGVNNSVFANSSSANNDAYNPSLFKNGTYQNDQSLAPQGSYTQPQTYQANSQQVASSRITQAPMQSQSQMPKSQGGSQQAQGHAVQHNHEMDQAAHDVHAHTTQSLRVDTHVSFKEREILPYNSLRDESSAYHVGSAQVTSNSFTKSQRDYKRFDYVNEQPDNTLGHKYADYATQNASFASASGAPYAQYAQGAQGTYGATQGTVATDSKYQELNNLGSSEDAQLPVTNSYGTKFVSYFQSHSPQEDAIYNRLYERGRTSQEQLDTYMENLDVSRAKESREIYCKANAIGGSLDPRDMWDYANIAFYYIDQIKPQTFSQSEQESFKKTFGFDNAIMRIYEYARRQNIPFEALPSFEGIFRLLIESMIIHSLDLTVLPDFFELFQNVARSICEDDTLIVTCSVRSDYYSDSRSRLPLSWSMFESLEEMALHGIRIKRVTTYEDYPQSGSYYSVLRCFFFKEQVHRSWAEKIQFNRDYHNPDAADTSCAEFNFLRNDFDCSSYSTEIKTIALSHYIEKYVELNQAQIGEVNSFSFSEQVNRPTVTESVSGFANKFSEQTQQLSMPLVDTPYQSSEVMPEMATKPNLAIGQEASEQIFVPEHVFESEIFTRENVSAQNVDLVQGANSSQATVSETSEQSSVQAFATPVAEQSKQVNQTGMLNPTVPTQFAETSLNAWSQVQPESVATLQTAQISSRVPLEPVALGAAAITNTALSVAQDPSAVASVSGPQDKISADTHQYDAQHNSVEATTFVGIATSVKPDEDAETVEHIEAEIVATGVISGATGAFKKLESINSFAQATPQEIADLLNNYKFDAVFEPLPPLKQEQHVAYEDDQEHSLVAEAYVREVSLPEYEQAQSDSAQFPETKLEDESSEEAQAQNVEQASSQDSYDSKDLESYYSQDLYASALATAQNAEYTEEAEEDDDIEDTEESYVTDDTSLEPSLVRDTEYLSSDIKATDLHIALAQLTSVQEEDSVVSEEESEYLENEDTAHSQSNANKPQTKATKSQTVDIIDVDAKDMVVEDHCPFRPNGEEEAEEGVINIEAEVATIVEAKPEDKSTQGEDIETIETIEAEQVTVIDNTKEHVALDAVQDLTKAGKPRKYRTQTKSIEHSKAIIPMDKGLLEANRFAQSISSFRSKIKYPRAKGDYTQIAGAVRGSHMAVRMQEAENKFHISPDERLDYDLGLQYATSLPDPKLLLTGSFKLMADGKGKAFSLIGDETADVDVDPEELELLHPAVAFFKTYVKQRLTNQTARNAANAAFAIVSGIRNKSETDIAQFIQDEFKSRHIALTNGALQEQPAQLEYMAEASASKATTDGQSNTGKYVASTQKIVSGKPDASLDFFAFLPQMRGTYLASVPMSATGAVAENDLPYVRDMAEQATEYDKQAEDEISNHQNLAQAQSEAEVQICGVAPIASALAVNQGEAGEEEDPSVIMTILGPSDPNKPEEPKEYRRAKVNIFKTFENFVPSPETSNVIDVAKSIVESPGLGHTPFFVHSGAGLGKTHLMYAIANEIKKQHPHLVVTYIRAEDFIFNYVRSIKYFNDPKHKRRTTIAESALYRDILDSDVVLVDDIQNFSRAAKSRDAFFEVIATFMEMPKHQLVLAADVPPRDLVKQGFNPRLTSRFSSGICYELHVPSVSARRTIVSAKSSEIGLKFSETLIDYLADNLNRSIRDIEGAVKSIGAIVLNKGGVSLLSAANLVSSYIPMPESMKGEELSEEAQLSAQDSIVSSDKVTLETVKKVVARAFKISPADLAAKSRRKELSTARSMAMLIAKELISKVTLCEIGISFNRDHSSVIEAIQRLRHRFATDHDLRHFHDFLVNQILSPDDGKTGQKKPEQLNVQQEQVATEQPPQDNLDKELEDTESELKDFPYLNSQAEVNFEQESKVVPVQVLTDKQGQDPSAVVLAMANASEQVLESPKIQAKPKSKRGRPRKNKDSAKLVGK